MGNARPLELQPCFPPVLCGIDSVRKRTEAGRESNPPSRYADMSRKERPQGLIEKVADELNLLRKLGRERRFASWQSLVRRSGRVAAAIVPRPPATPGTQKSTRPAKDIPKSA